MQSTIKMYLLVGISIFFLTDLINPQSGISLIISNVQDNQAGSF